MAARSRATRACSSSASSTTSFDRRPPDAVPDGRDRRYVTHDVLALLRQRIYQIGARYEAANDTTYLRHDSTLQLSPIGSGHRSARATLSRLENGAPWDTIRRIRVLRQWFTRHAVAHCDLPP